MEVEPNSCNECDKTFMDGGNLSGMWYPQQCEDFNEEKPAVYIDIRPTSDDDDNDDNKDAFLCTFCDGAFNDQQNFRIHLKEHINSENTKTEPGFEDLL